MKKKSWFNTEYYRDFAVAVAIVTPDGLVMVKDNTKITPAWKHPGGKRDDFEDPEACAIREVDEETGIKLRPGQLRRLYKENRGNHDVYFFGVILTINPKVKDNGSDGEEVRIIPLGEIIERPATIFEPHLRPIKVREFMGLSPVEKACLA